MTMQNDLDYDELYENLKEELGREPNEDEINERFENSSNQVLTIFDNVCYTIDIGNKKSHKENKNGNQDFKKRWSGTTKEL